MSTDDAHQRLHAAIEDWLGEGEIAIHWVLTIDVAGPEGLRYLAHRSGGGHDGSQQPMCWTAIGMLEASADVAREQLRETTVDSDEDDD